MNASGDGSSCDNQPQFGLWLETRFAYSVKCEKENIAGSFPKFRQKCLNCVSLRGCLKPRNVNVLLSCDESRDDYFAGEEDQEDSPETAMDLYKLSPKFNPKNKGPISAKKDILHFDMLMKAGGKDLASKVKNSVPIVQVEEGLFDVVTIPVHLQCATAVNVHETIDNLPLRILEELELQLNEFEKCLLRFSDEEADIYCSPRPYTYYIEDQQRYLTVFYPDNISETELESYRREIHIKNDLPLTKPCVRKSMAIKGLSENDPGKFYLRNVHEYVSHEKGYTDKPVPTHKEIQKVHDSGKTYDMKGDRPELRTRALVDCGDKQASFIGSKQWVGSIELSFCLDQIDKIQSRIVRASSGLEMPSTARELAHHFETQGSPIMIGGGVLAHTILGIDYNEETGDCRFLVLDPHYTGSEDVKTIVDKGWCGWKGANFWKDDAFYNLLLVQNPEVI